MKPVVTADQLRPHGSQIGWVPRHELDAHQWVAAGRRIGLVGRCIQWLIGDWIAYGNTRFGERYSRASQITGYDPQTLMNMVYVASRFAGSRRRENLSWSHHETLAALEQHEQDQWLDQAAKHQWSVSDLRTMLRSTRKAEHGAQGATNTVDAVSGALGLDSRTRQSLYPAILRRAHSDRRALEYRLGQRATALPYFRAVTGPIGPVTLVEGRDQVMLGSNNYLGLASHPRVIDAARSALERYGSGVTGSRLLNGTLDLHAELEAELAAWLGTPDALVFTTGYQANVGMLTGLLGASDVVICDSADHASILDGAVLSGARLMPFHHGRLDRLERLLQRQPAPEGELLVVVDSVFSMRGDVADLRHITELCRAAGAALAVDEAHAIGVLGPHGEGAAGELGVAANTHLRVGTFSKALASTGGFVAGDSSTIDLLRVKSRSLLFTTAAVPAAIGAALMALRICRSTEGAELMARLHENVRYLRGGLNAIGVPTVEPSRLGERYIMSAIVPVIVGHDYRAILLWKALYERGIYTNVALYPAVSRGRAVIRLSVMATHTREHLDRAIEAFADVAKDSDAMDDNAALIDAFVERAANGEPVELAS